MTPQMRPIIAYSMAFILCITFILRPIPIDAQEDNQQTYYQVLQLALEEYKNLEQYEINLKLTNTDADELISIGRIIGDQTRGTLMLELEFYEYPSNASQEEEVEPEVHPIRLMSYGNFELVYINQIEWLNTQGFFKQAYFNEEVSQEMEKLEDQMVAINASELERIQIEPNVFESLLLLPNYELLTQIDPSHIHYDGSAYSFDIERTEIPEGLFSSAGQFNLEYMLNMNIDETNPEADHQWDVNTTQRVNIGQQTSGINFQFDVQSQLSNGLLPILMASSSGESDQEVENFESNYFISSRDVTNKLTEVDFYLHPQEQLYRLTLTGIAEDINLNIFETNTANVNSANYELEIQVQPTYSTMPSFDSLNRMTNAEFNYYLETVLNKTEE